MSDIPTANAVFLSYASQDAEAARRICEALRAAGIEVWFDQSELRGGDAWDAKIRKQIRDCALFVPVISANTEARLEGYFRLEWKLAEDRSHLMAKGKPFIVPVTVDGTTERDARVPDAFLAVQWTRLPVRQAQGGPAGEAAAGFGERVKSLLSGASTLEAGRPRPAQRDDGVASPERRQVGRSLRARRIGFAVAGVGVLVAIGLSWWRWRPPTSASPVTESAARRPAFAQGFGGQGSAPPNSEETSAISDKSLVVLPLENLSPDPENAFFTDAIHTEIIETLTRLSDLKVIRRGSALAFKGSTAPLAEIAQKLGVANVITGSVRREKDRVRISLELRRASDEAVLWGPQTRERTLADAFAIQTEIAGEVARVLRARESKGYYGGAQFTTKDPRAYDLFVKARALYDIGGRPEARRLAEEALVEYRRAIDLDPLSGVVWQNYINWLSRLRRGPECADAIAKCLATPSGNARVQVLARARHLLTGELPATLDGMSDGQRADWLWLSRRFDELIAIADDAMARPDLSPIDRFEGLMLRHRVLRHLGRTEEAKVGAALALALAEEFRNAPAIHRTQNELRLARALALVGRGDEAVALALRCVNAFVATNPGRALWSRQIELAEMYANLGRTRECVKLLAKLLRIPSGLTVPMLRVDPVWDNVREDAGFKALLADPKNSAPL